MEHLIALLQATEDGNGVLHRRLRHQHRLEPALQGRVLLDILTVFVQGSGADTVELTPGQHGLQQIAGVHRALGFASPHDGVQLVDEKQNLALTLAHLIEDSLQPLFELAPVLGASHQRAHVQGEDGLVLEALGHVAPDNSLGQSLYHGGLAHAGLADEDRVVLGLSGQDPDHVPNLIVPADDGVQLVLLGPLY